MGLSMSNTNFQFNSGIFLPSLLSFFPILLFDPSGAHPFVPTRGPLIAAARRDRSRMAVAQAVQRAAAFPGHFLTGPTAGSGRVGLIGPAAFRLSEQGGAQRSRATSLYSADPRAGSNHDAVM